MAPTLYMQDFSPPVRAVLLTAEALGLNMDCKIIDLAKKEHLTDNFLRLNPQHTIPTLDDNGVIIGDSHAITTYLVDKYGKNDYLYPKDLAKRALVNQRLHFANGVIFSWIRYIARGLKYKGRKSLSEDQDEALEEAYAFLESFLKNSEWVAGNTVTIADFHLVTDVTAANFLKPIDFKKYPNIQKWLEKVESLPCYHVNREGFETFKKMFTPLLQ